MGRSARGAFFVAQRRTYCCKQQSDAPPTVVGKKVAKKRLALARTSDKTERSLFRFYARKKAPTRGAFFVAQRRRFELPDEFSPSHDFQSCSLNHSDISANRRFSKVPINSTVFFQKKQAFLLRFIKKLEKTYFLCLGLITSAGNPVFHKAGIKTFFANVLGRKLCFADAQLG